MRTASQLITALVLASAFVCRAQEATYYRQLVSLIGTNDFGVRGVTSAFLTDTNNVARKLTNTLAKLRELKRSGEVSGVRLGQTAEDVVARWGKPRWVWSRCYGGPRLCYSGVSVVLEPFTNSVMTILLEDVWTTHPRHFTAKQCLSQLGEPKAWKGLKDGTYCSLFYEAPGGTMRLAFSEDEIESVRLESHSK